MKYFLTLVALQVTFFMFAQAQKECIGTVTVQQETQAISKNEIAQMSVVSLTPQFQGNFQFIIQEDKKPLLTNDVMLFVENNRALDEDLIVDFSDRIKLFIPSKKIISSSDFKELPLYKF